MDKVIRNPDLLLSYNLEKEDERTCDSERYVWYKRRIYLGDGGFYLEAVITFSVSIDDSPTSNDTTNRSYFHENSKWTLNDDNDNTISRWQFNIEDVKHLDKLAKVL